jgi:hypothetical protein
MENFDKEKYEQAKKKVSEIKGFYNHLIVYIIVNAFLLFIHMGLFNNGLFELRTPSWSSLGTPFFWGIGLAFHAIKVFHDNFTFFKNWEDRKIKEIMDKEEEELKRTNKRK